MITYKFTYEVTTESGITEATALRWLERCLANPDLELPDHVFSVQTMPSASESEAN